MTDTLNGKRNRLISFARENHDWSQDWQKGVEDAFAIMGDAVSTENTQKQNLDMALVRKSPVFDALSDLREKLTQLKQLAGREMDYGSKSDALQDAYILTTEALKIMEEVVANEGKSSASLANGPKGDNLASSTTSTLSDCREAFEQWISTGGDANWHELVARDAKGNYTNSITKGGWFVWLKLWPQLHQREIRLNEEQLANDIARVVRLDSGKGFCPGITSNEIGKKIIDEIRPYLKREAQPTEIPVSRMEVLRTATLAEIKALSWDDMSKDKPYIMQLRDNLKEWSAIAKDREKSIEALMAARDSTTRESIDHFSDVNISAPDEREMLLGRLDEISMMASYIIQHGIGGDVSRIDKTPMIKSASIDEVLDIFKQIHKLANSIEAKKS